MTNLISLCVTLLVLVACQVSEQKPSVKPWPKVLAELKKHSGNELMLLQSIQLNCPKNINNQPNPVHVECVNWVVQELAESKDEDGKLTWGRGKGFLISNWLLSTHPDLVIARQILAREIFLQGKVERAKEILLELEGLEHAQGFEAYWLAQVERKLGNYEAAQDYAREFEEFGVAEPQVYVELQEQLQSEEADQTISEDWDNTSTPHFKIYTEGEISQAEWVGEVLEDKWSQLRSTLGLNFSDEIDVVLYEDNNYGGQAAQNAWVAASYNGKLRIPIQGVQDSEQFQKLMIHELTHALLDVGIGKDVPMWFHEGLAQYMEGKRLSKHPNYYSGLFKDRSAPSLSQLKESFVHEHDGYQVKKRYAIALAMVEAMISQGGLEEFQNLISLSIQNESFEESWPLIYSGDNWKVSALYESALSSLF